MTVGQQSPVFEELLSPAFCDQFKKECAEAIESVRITLVSKAVTQALENQKIIKKLKQDLELATQSIEQFADVNNELLRLIARRNELLDNSENERLIQKQCVLLESAKRATNHSMKFAKIFSHEEEAKDETFRGSLYESYKKFYSSKLYSRYSTVLNHANKSLRIAKEAHAQAQLVDYLLTLLNEIVFSKENLRQFWNKQIPWGKWGALVCAAKVNVGSYEPFYLPVPRGVFGARTVLDELSDLKEHKLTDAQKADILKRTCMKMKDRLPKKGEIKDKATEVLYSKLAMFLDQNNHLKLNIKDVEAFTYSLTQDMKFQYLNLKGYVPFRMSAPSKELTK